MNNNSIYPGLTNLSSEYFNMDDKRFLLTAGSVSEVKNFNPVFYKLLSEAIKKDKQVSRALDQLGLQSESSRVSKFFDCNYSEFDKNPDVNEDNTLGIPEYVKCPFRGNCIHEGKLCKLPYGLTKREVLVIKYIGQGLLDKEICDKMNISPCTLRNHKDNISAKTGTERKPLLGVIAYQAGIL